MIARFDPEYTKERQQGLQAYLRRILKIPNMLTVSKDLQQFLNIVKLPERVITDDMKAYLEYKRNNIIYYPPEQDDEEGKLEPQYGSGSRFRVQHREGKLLRSREEVEEEARRKFSSQIQIISPPSYILSIARVPSATLRSTRQGGRR